MKGRNLVSRSSSRSAFSSRTLALLSAFTCGLVLSTGACAVNMDNWKLTKMDPSLRQEGEAICPRSKVQIKVYAEVEHKKKPGKTKALETWEGEAKTLSFGKIGKIDFKEFVFSSDQGSIDDNGFFTPNPDVLVSAASGFAITTAYKADAAFYKTREYRPEYSCILDAGSSGVAGPGGDSGSSGTAGASGSSGASDKAGGQGSNGTAGGQGSNGGDGQPGPNLQVYATFVKTPFHEKLALVKISGDTEDTVLIHPDKTFTVHASGGPGGGGGSGGSGGPGGRGGSGNPGGNGGNGGAGGNGGVGGNGGPGGTITFTYDPKFPELANLVVLDVAGGPGGSAGSAGSAGTKGSGGSATGEGAKGGGDGAAGAPGAQGQGGSSGPDGKAQAQAGNVDSVFSGLPDKVERL